MVKYRSGLLMKKSRSDDTLLTVDFNLRITDDEHPPPPPKSCKDDTFIPPKCRPMRDFGEAWTFLSAG